MFSTGFCLLVILNGGPVHPFQSAPVLLFTSSRSQHRLERWDIRSQFISQTTKRHARPRHGHRQATHHTNGDSTGSDDSGDSGDNAISLLGRPESQSRLSHAMLQVPSVDTTVAYWKETANGQVTASSPVPKKESADEETRDKLQSAFVVLGNGKTTDNCFALELVRNKHNTFDLGNGLSYIGVSKLVQFASKEDLIAVITGEQKPEPPKEEPNGIAIQSCASAPGDYLARICLHSRSKKLNEITNFYHKVLGMDIAAQDEQMLCLRYPHKIEQSEDKIDNENDDKSFYGVPTTLVFQPLPEGQELSLGNCLDHFVVETKASMEAVYTEIQSTDCQIFMKPTVMFGKTVLGVMDPNGYKVIMAGPE